MTKSNDILVRIIKVAGVYLAELLLLFGCAGTLAWGWGWAWACGSLLVLVVNAFVMRKEVIAERGKHKQDAKPWDKKLTKWMLLPMALVFVVCGLDHRFGWSSTGLAVPVAGCVAFALGYAVLIWAVRTNVFFSTLVRLQKDRGHTVVSSGPYSIVRHPGYAGLILVMLSTAAMTCSLWGLIPATAYAALLVVRTTLEDRT